MTRARDIANLVDANGDIVAGALDNVPAADLVNDTTPQLGGALDAQSNNITGVGDLIITGSGGTSTNSLDITYNSSSGVANIQADSNGGSTSLTFGTSNSGTVANRLEISSSGVVTKPYTPAFHSGSGTGGNQTGVYRIGSTESGQNTYYVRDNGNNFNTSNGRFTAPVAGWYFFHAMASPSQGANSGIYITKNGSQTSGTAYIYGQSYNGGSISAVIQMAANDYAEGIHSPFNGTNEGQYSGAFTGFLIG